MSALRSVPPGLDLAVLVLNELGVDSERISIWMRQQHERALADRTLAV